MNCRETRKWLSPYLDSELEQTKTFEVSEHLRVCPECADRFEAERNAEALGRASLERETMPAVLWQRIARDISRPSWVSRLAGRKALSLAAAIAIAVATWSVLPGGTIDASPTWLVDSFVAETSTNQPFADADSDAVLALRELRDALKLSFALTGEAAARGGHLGFQIISTTRRIDPSGRPFVEVRLNCCGQPVLLAFAATDANGTSSLDGILNQPASTATAYENLNIDARRIGSVVAVALSRHPVKGILANVSQASS